MRYTVRFRRAAEQDVSEALEWYESQQLGLGSSFLDEFDATISSIAEQPLLYPELYRSARRAVLHRFPYLVWYRTDESSVLVLACTHGKLNPKSVKRR
ncbi:MAG: type II toxin-antitoxin system RelE/ParE family toxin, partial [Abyssibacter sp.]|uniref:type II toxin-antitoxin system RelE/ParE family toxin n=1 Tax=Abyssibacter sp. TaxID=2320200 RepID=UPI0032192EFB